MQTTHHAMPATLLAHGGRWTTAAMTAIMLVLLAVAPISAATQTMAPACSGVNVRSGPTTGAPVKVSLSLSNTLTVSGTVTGSSWGASCPTWKSGAGWYVVTAINGQPVSSRYGVSVLYAATGVLTATSTPTSVDTSTSGAAPAAVATAAVPAPTPTTTPAGATTATPAQNSSYVPACSGINLRTSPTTSSTVAVKLGLAGTLTVLGVVTGSAWRTTCPTYKAASTWYAVTAINGQTVSSRYGVSVIYAATGILNRAPGSTTATLPWTDTSPVVAPPVSAPTPVPAPTPTPATTVVTAPAPASATNLFIPGCDGINLRTSTSTSSTVKVRLPLASTVTVTRTATGAWWRATCPTATSGTGWYAISEVNGQSVSQLYGVTALYAAT
ncbi:MAG: hypothetical protein ABIQ17_06360, partial [Candidatus Limnocylindrales bacterium]